MNKYAFVLVVKYNPLRIDMTSHFNETEKRTVYTPFSFTYPCTFSQQRDYMQLYI